MLNWNSAALFNFLFWPKKSVSCLVNMTDHRTPRSTSERKAALAWQKGPYSQALGFCMKKFSPEAKADVEQQDHDWGQQGSSLKADWLALKPAKAIVKLNVITPHIGYPEITRNIMPKRSSTRAKLGRKCQNYKFPLPILEQVEPTSRSERMAHASPPVNAYYDPQQNQIVFPAAILQAPFWWPSSPLIVTSQLRRNRCGHCSRNLPRLWHHWKLSFDEHGSLKTGGQKITKPYCSHAKGQFEGQDSYGAKINGKLTVSENVADLRWYQHAALEAAKKEEDFSAEEFFTNFACIWRMKARQSTCNSSQVSMSTHQENSTNVQY